ncbi:endonuclease 4 [Actinidia rufa]|uniref:Aspergillus nuclease S1 n=1 Tax=Actinidia rufa TaxID=165716 RepID=A0A7J0F022_9ERIC|nr:endonuclease 4 [Actinidia rufa]
MARIATAILLLQLIPGALSWGKEGHYAICKIAEGYLSEDASAAVKELLPDYAEGDLASVCSWADEIRRSYRWRWSGPLHYIDTPDFRCNYSYSITRDIPIHHNGFLSESHPYCKHGDCHDSKGHQNMCATGAIYNYTMQLMSAYNNPNSGMKYNLTEALLFLAHIMGDVHQENSTEHCPEAVTP